MLAANADASYSDADCNVVLLFCGLKEKENLQN